MFSRKSTLNKTQGREMNYKEVAVNISTALLFVLVSGINGKNTRSSTSCKQLSQAIG